MVSLLGPIKWSIQAPENPSLQPVWRLVAVLQTLYTPLDEPNHIKAFKWSALTGQVA